MKTLGVENVSAQVEATWFAAVEKALSGNKVTVAVVPIASLAQGTSGGTYVDKLRAKGYTVVEPE